MTTRRATHMGLFATRAELQAFLAAWRRRALDRQIDSTDVMLRNLLLGASPLRGFSPTTRPVKLQNGRRANHHAERAVIALHYSKIDHGAERASLAYYQRIGLPVPQSLVSDLEKPLPITLRWGCSPEAPEDFSAGLSMQRFLQVKQIAAGMDPWWSSRA